MNACRNVRDLYKCEHINVFCRNVSWASTSASPYITVRAGFKFGNIIWHRELAPSLHPWKNVTGNVNRNDSERCCNLTDRNNSWEIFDRTNATEILQHPNISIEHDHKVRMKILYIQLICNMGSVYHQIYRTATIFSSQLRLYFSHWRFIGWTSSEQSERRIPAAVVKLCFNDKSLNKTQRTLAINL